MKFEDQINRILELGSYPPQRIVCLVPSITELLFDLDLNEEVCGITKFCVHPSEAKEDKVIVGGTKNPRLERIEELHPDLIIANKEENRPEDIQILEQKYPVYVSDVVNYDSALEMIQDIGSLTNRREKAALMLKEIGSRNQHLIIPRKPLTVLYLIWENPLMTVGSDTYIHDRLERIGLKNVMADDRRYPQLSTDELLMRKPDVILLSSEPYPFKEKHREEYAARFPDSKVLLVDGEMFSWYGSRMLESFLYFNKIISEIHR